METVFLKARFDLFRNGESMQLTHDVVKACTDADAAKLKIDFETTELKKATDSMDSAFEGRSGSSLTEEIIGLDHLRDDAIIGIKPKLRNSLFKRILKDFGIVPKPTKPRSSFFAESYF